MRGSKVEIVNGEACVRTAHGELMSELEYAMLCMYRRRWIKAKQSYRWWNPWTWFDMSMWEYACRFEAEDA